MNILKRNPKYHKHDEERAWYHCPSCGKMRWHDTSRDGIYVYFTCVICGNSIEFSDLGK